MNNDQLQYLIALNEFSKFGPRRMRRLFKYFDSAQSIFSASSSELHNAGIHKNIIKEFISFRTSIEPHALLKLIQSKEISTISIFDEDYPELLKEIYDPPFLLYIKGKLPKIKNQKLLGIVGSRKASIYGQQIAKNLTQEIARSGIITVSGLAYGIDEIIHLSTIKANGPTIAVLGFGILHKSTAREQTIQKHIIEHGGAIISEFPIRMIGNKYNFPIRNRIISGMCHGTLVVEAAKKSGSLITARSALEQNREVFAIPGPINSKTSEGTNNLIKTGAHVVTNIQDILEPLEIHRIASTSKRKIHQTGDNPEEIKILELLSNTPMHIDEITRQSNLPAHIVASTISILELKSFITNTGGDDYCAG